MNFYEIAVNDRGLKTLESLTYSSLVELKPGDIVRVSVRSRKRNGIVLNKVEKPKYSTKQIETVILEDGIPNYLVRLITKLSSYYAVSLGLSVGLVLPKGIEKKRRDKQMSNSTPVAKRTMHDLTDLQKSAVEKINSSEGTYLLKGVTGSGKTRVYIELAKFSKEKKQGSIILVPEIGLTSQMVKSFIDYFGESEVFVVHSNQTETERHKIWEDIRRSESPIVIGPRSALFYPVKVLGLIVIDEEHETSYKQDQSPRYHAVRVASLLRGETGAKLVLGSATPSVEDYFLASLNNSESIVEMQSTVKKVSANEIHVIDMKKRDNFKRNNWVSDLVIQGIEDTLSLGKQVLIFQNRRGNSTSIICQNCGYIDECPNCFLPLTHHRDWGKNVCHTCNYSHSVQPNCPECKKPDLIYRGAGTKEIESLLQKLIPTASIGRFDSDVNSSDEKLESRFDEIVSGEIDIIIGTQMIAKGLDIPKLGMVGIINADTSLYLPDFSSSERTFQLISQVIGRVGRHSSGSVFIQTYSPDNPAISLAMQQKWDEFYSMEIESRRMFDYPPFQFLLKLTIEKKTSDSARDSADRLSRNIKSNINDVTVLGPSPAFHHTTRNGWRWQLVIKSRNRSKLVNIAKNLPPDWQFDLDPINLL